MTAHKQRLESVLEKNVPRETFALLENYVAMITKWQAHLNLVATATLTDVWERHIIDSAQLLRFVPNMSAALVDMGSGAGLPGMVLAILGMQDVTLLESDQKKCVFLEEVRRVLHLPVTVACGRIESAAGRSRDIVTARALAPLSVLLDYAMPIMHADSFCLFPKGKNYAKEIEDAQTSYDFTFTMHASVTDKDSGIIEIRAVKKMGQG